MRSRWLFPLAGLALVSTLNGACGQSNLAVDAAESRDASTTNPDVESGGDAFPDAGESADGAPATPDGILADFMAIVPCLDPTAYADSPPSVSTPGNAYSPACLRVAVGSTVTIEASVAHPLEPRGGGTPGNPIPAQIDSARVMFGTPGFYPFLCPEHVDQGMLGVIWVTAK
jgi:plastocyanin